MSTMKNLPLFQRLRAGHLACLILAIHAGLVAWSATRHSPPSDEVGHMAAGLNHWHTGNFDLYRVNPPLVRLMATAPLAASGIREPDRPFNPHPLSRPEFFLGRDFVSEHGERSFWYFTLARWACLPFTLLGGYVCYRWGQELYDARAGLLSLTLWCFCPIVMANAQMITPDTGATACGALAGYLFWKWFREPSWTRASWMGMALGIALLCKTSWIILFPLWPSLWLVLRLTKRPFPALRHWLTQGMQLAIGVALGLSVINTGYLFEDSFVELGRCPFISKSLTVVEDGKIKNRFAGTWVGRVPMPVPRNFLLGIDVQRRDFERNFWSYLRGEWRQKGWWYYYLYGLAVKWPVGTWLLLLAAIGSIGFIANRSATWRDEVLLLSPGIALLALVSSQTGFNHHIRYVLPAFPFLFIWMGRLAQASLKSWIWRGCILAALVVSIGSSLRVYPHSMSYFNELAGGPMNGHAHLLDSNIDWGQDLLHLKRWLDEHPDAKPLRLAYFGFIDPRAAGIEFALPPKGPIDAIDLQRADAADLGPHPGWHAISVTLLRGYRYNVADGKGGMEYLDREYYTYFLRFQPKATAGYSIYIYYLSEEDCVRVRAELGLPSAINK